MYNLTSNNLCWTAMNSKRVIIYNMRSLCLKTIIIMFTQYMYKFQNESIRSVIIATKDLFPSLC